MIVYTEERSEVDKDPEGYYDEYSYLHSISPSARWTFTSMACPCSRAMKELTSSSVTSGGKSYNRESVW